MILRHSKCASGVFLGGVRTGPAALCLFVLALASGASAVEGPSAPPLGLVYHLRLSRPTTHLLEVEIVANKVGEPSLDFSLPAWAPGRYAIYDFAKNVQEFEALGARGQPLTWTKLDKQTWHVEGREAGGSVKVRYRVFANDLTGSFSQFDTTHASLNLANVFMYVRGHKPDPITLTLEVPSQWRVFSSLSASLGQTSFHLPNYDRLVDSPFEASPHLTLDQFQDHGKTIRVVVHTYDEDDKDRSKLLEGLKKIVASELAAMPEPDFDHYTFFFHFDPTLGMGDGMEHFDSTDIILRGTLEENVTEAIETAAHEFFHLWNIKRLRPAGLGPFDYEHETYSRSLWFAEGITSYLAYRHLLRSGLWTRDQFLGRLAEEIRNLEGDPGHLLMSAESSSFHAWFYDRSPQMQETNFANVTISYYNKGAALGMLLDLEARARTQGQKSLEDVVKAMYHKFYEAPAETYYAPGRGYQEKDVLEALQEVSGSDFSSFFERYIAGTQPLPYSDDLARAGLRLRVSVPAGSGPSVGAIAQLDLRGAKIFAVRPGSAAERAGLSRDDLIVAVDDQPLATQELRDRLKAYSPGAEVPFTIERHGRRQIIIVKLDPPSPSEYAIEDLPNATPEQVRLRKAWLGEGP